MRRRGWLRKDREGKGVRYRYQWETAPGKIKTKSLPVGTSAAAARKLRDRWNASLEEQRNRPERPNPWTLEEAKERVLESRDYSPRHLANLEIYWREIFAFFGEARRMDRINVGDVLDWIHRLRKEKGVRNTTIRHHVFALSRAFRYASKKRVVDFNPCRDPDVDRELPNDQRARDRVLTDQEVRAVFEAADGNTRTFILLAWSTAARHREILAIEWKDIDAEAGTIRIEHNPAREKRTKSKRSRTVHVAPEVIRYLLDNQKPLAGCPWVFHHRDGRRIGSLGESVTGAVRRAGLEGITAHTIRHSVDSFFLREGVDPVTARDHLGHANLNMTNRYAHAYEEQAKAAAEKLIRVIEGETADNSADIVAEIEAEIQRLEEVQEVVNAVETLVCAVERETGFEPATLSLEG